MNLFRHTSLLIRGLAFVPPVTVGYFIITVRWLVAFVAKRPKRALTGKPKTVQRATVWVWSAVPYGDVIEGVYKGALKP